MTTTAVGPAEPTTIRLGRKKYDLVYGVKAKQVVEERHGSLDGFLFDFTSSIAGSGPYWRCVVTIVMAGASRYRLTEDQIDELAGEDTLELDQEALRGWRRMAPAFGWKHLVRDDNEKPTEEDVAEAEESGEAPGAQTAPTESDGATSSTAESPTSA